MRIFTTLAVLAAFAAPAAAADLYRGQSLKDGPVVDAPYNWSGLYLGGFLGVHANNTTIDVSSFASLDGIGSQGLMGGGEIGYDLQAGNVVFGVFGRYDVPSAESTLTIGGTSIKDSQNYLWTAGGRAGVLVGADKGTLLFGEVGYSQGQYEFTAPGFSWTRTPSGITAGGGIERQLGNGFSAKLVADWTGFDSVSAPVPYNIISTQTDNWRVQIGVDYKLNLGRSILN